METVEAVYIISLPKDHERCKVVQAQLTELCIPHEVFPAIEPDFNDDLFRVWQQQWLSPFHQKGAIGCMASHWAVANLALSRGQTRVLVLEDDVWFSKDFRREVSDAVGWLDQKRKNQWDCLYVEYCWPFANPRAEHEVVARRPDGHPMLMRSLGQQRSAGILHNGSSLRAFAEDLPLFRREIDIYMAMEYMPHHQCFVLPWPFGVVQGEFRSSITNMQRTLVLNSGLGPLYDPEKIKMSFTLATSGEPRPPGPPPPQPTVQSAPQPVPVRPVRPAPASRQQPQVRHPARPVGPNTTAAAGDPLAEAIAPSRRR